MTETWPEMRRRHYDERNALIVAAIEATDGNQTQAARIIGMNRITMQNTIREQGLTVLAPRFKRDADLPGREEWHNVR
jgi:DNA-binding NtrC family response regulator